MRKPFQTKLRLAKNHLSEGRYREALKTIVDEPAGSAGELYNKIALLIDVGCLLRDEKVLMYGTYLLEENLEEILSFSPHADTIYLNLGNQCVNITALKTFKERHYGVLTGSELGRGVSYYRKALICSPKTREARAKIHYNRAIALRAQGRALEALEEFHKGIHCEKVRVAARNNTADLLEKVAPFVPLRSDAILREAYKLSQEEGKEEELLLRDSFQARRERIEEILSQTFLEEEGPDNTIEVDSSWERHTISVCIREDLYLNPCGCYRRRDMGIGDGATLPQRDLPLRGREKERYETLLRLYDRIAEDYTVVRYLLIRASYEEGAPPSGVLTLQRLRPLKITSGDGTPLFWRQTLRVVNHLMTQTEWFLQIYCGIPSEKPLSSTEIWHRVAHCRPSLQLSVHPLYAQWEEFFCTHPFLALTEPHFSDKSGQESVPLSEGFSLLRHIRNRILYLLFLLGKDEEELGEKRSETLPLYAFEIPSL